MDKLLVSTGCLCTMRNGRDRSLIAKTAPYLHCNGFEFMMYGSWYDDWRNVLDDVRSMGLNIPAFHVEKRVGERITLGNIAEARDCFRINCEMAAALGAKTLVLHLWNGQPSDNNFSVNAAEYAVLRDMAEKCGLLLTVENVVCMYGDPLSDIGKLHDMYPGIAFTYDFKMAQFHGQVRKTFDDGQKWLWNSAVRHVHVSDINADYMDWNNLRSLHPGEGRIDFPFVFGKLNECGYGGNVTIESTSVNDDGTIQIDKLNRSLDFIRSLMG